MSRRTRKVPEVSLDLVRELDRLYPNRAPRNGESLESIYRYAGARAVVDQLIRWASLTNNVELIHVLCTQHSKSAAAHPGPSSAP
jgi:hypothetical protein